MSEEENTSRDNQEQLDATDSNDNAQVHKKETDIEIGKGTGKEVVAFLGFRYTFASGDPYPTIMSNSTYNKKEPIK